MPRQPPQGSGPQSSPPPAPDAPRDPAPEDAPVGPCPNCGAPMNAIRGSKLAICRNCGFKDSCCF
jgi:hypothetical protein